MCSPGYSCGNGSCAKDPPSCHIERTYPSSSSTYTSCSSSASHAIYKAKSSTPAGNYADITFTKCPDGGGPSVNVSYWVVTGVEYPTDSNLCQPYNAPKSCGTLSCCRATGTWSSSKSSLTVSAKLWPNESDINPANAGQTKRLYIETGGKDGYESKPIWYNAESVEYTIVCN